MYEEKRNTGITFDHIGDVRVCSSLYLPDNIPAKRTLIVSGVARGGTSMVSVVLDALGVDMGAENDPHSWEDCGLTSPNQIKRNARLLHRRKEHNDRALWGWKGPGALGYISTMRNRLKNPWLIVVWRCSLATAQGQARVARTDNIYDALRAVHRSQRLNLDLIFQHKLPTVLVSYERAVILPEQFVDELSDLVQIKPIPTTAQRREAVSRINRTGGYYHDWSRQREDTGSG